VTERKVSFLFKDELDNAIYDAVSTSKAKNKLGTFERNYFYRHLIYYGIKG
jgi:hypothetical protein